MVVDFNSSFPAMVGNTLTVGQLNLAINGLLERGLPVVTVRGEISNFTRAASQHWYFSLKDDTAQIRCVMFRTRNQLLNFQPREGQEVELRGLVGMYQARGELQLNVESMRAFGAGDLFAAFLALKEKLAKMGLFEAQRKRPLPTYPKAVGIITSLQAAALADVLTAFSRRSPHIKIIIYPSPVQGFDAAPQLVKQLVCANQRAEVDVLLLCRGGGSIEDLWAFNEEALAHAIAQSHLPVVTGIGHETDFTIADFVADLRAPTPTAAAELVSPDYRVLLQNLEQAALSLRRYLQRRLHSEMQRLDHLVSRLPHPRLQVRIQQQVFLQTKNALSLVMRLRVSRAQAQLDRCYTRLVAARPQRAVLWAYLEKNVLRLQIAQRQLRERAQKRYEAATSILEMLSPQRILDRGYAVILNDAGCAVREVEELQIGVDLDVRLAQGRAVLTLATIKKSSE